jgi:hypothetical protein
MIVNKQQVLLTTSPIPSGEGFDEVVEDMLFCTTETFCVGSLVDSRMKMASGNEETIHTYLRRHFEKVSKRNAGRETEKATAAIPIPNAHVNNN